MTSLSSNLSQQWQNLVPYTQLSGAPGSFLVTFNAPNAHAIHFQMGCRISDGTSGAGSQPIRFTSATSSSFDCSGYIATISGTPSLALDNINGGTNLPVVGIAGTDAPANMLTILDIYIYNWDIQGAHWGTYDISLPFQGSAFGQLRRGFFEDRNLVTYAGINIGASGKTYDSKSYYKVDQIG